MNNLQKGNELFLNKHYFIKKIASKGINGSIDKKRSVFSTMYEEDLFKFLIA